MTPVQRSIFFSAVERYASIVLLLVSTAVLARLLDPREFGVYAVVNAVTAVIASAFQEFGGANYLIQKRDPSRESIRTAFTVTFIISAAVGGVLYLLAGPAARFFGQEGLEIGIAVSALNFLLTPFSGTLVALRRRSLEFGALAICNLVAGAAGAIASVALALMKFSYMAPIWGGIVGNAVLMVMLLLWHRDLSVFRPSFVECRDVVRFGLYSGGVVVINVLYSFAPQLFLARILDFTSVGLYTRAGNITQVFDKLVMQVLNPVIMPAIVARRSAGEDLRRVYLESIQLLSAVQWPALLFVGIMARSIISLWLGQNWLEIVPLVQILCIANMAFFSACLSYPVLVSVGRVRDALMASFISLPPSLLVILGASFFGVEAVAASALLTLPFQAAVALHFIMRHLDIGWADLAKALTKSVVATALMAVGVAACAALVEFGAVGSVTGLACACVAAAICWLIGLSVTGHPLLSHIQHAAGGLAVIVPGLQPKRSES